MGSCGLSRKIGRFIIGLACLLALSPARADVSVAGSSTLLPIVRDAANIFEQQTGIKVKVSGGGSDSGVSSIIGGTADIGMVSRHLVATETALLNSVLIANDGIAVVVNQRNPLVNLGSSQVRGIFSKRIERWSDLDWKDGGQIVPVIKSAGRSTRTLFDQQFNIGNAIPSGFHEVGANVAMVLFVAADPQSIGYVSIGTLEDARQRGLRVQGLLIDGVPPTMENCHLRRYPLCRPLYLVTRGIPRPEVRKFLEFMSGPTVAEITAKHRFSPVSAMP